MKANKEFIFINNSRINVEYIGKKCSNLEKDNIIFLHDSWGCTKTWKDFPLKICKISGKNGILYDRAGYGRSDSRNILRRELSYLHEDANNLIQLLDQLKIHSVSLYGHSDGASIALIAASMFPKRIKWVICESPHVTHEKEAHIPIQEIIERAKSNNLLAKLREYHNEKTDNVFRLWHETWLDQRFNKWNITDLLRKIECPVLGIRGQNDRLTSNKQLDLMTASIKNCTIYNISNAAHTPRKENEVETIKIIEKWFNLNDQNSTLSIKSKQKY